MEGSEEAFFLMKQKTEWGGALRKGGILSEA